MVMGELRRTESIWGPHLRRQKPATTSLCKLLLAGLMLTGCSMKQMAVDMVADSVAEGGGTYASDDDPELIREALPFGLKTYESLLAESPEHMGLLLATAK